MIYRLLLTVGCVVLLFLSETVQAGELILHDGSMMTIGDGSTLTMNCDNITLETGAELINSGTILTLGELIKASGSTFTNTGTTEQCYPKAVVFQLNGSFYVIKVGL